MNVLKQGWDDSDTDPVEHQIQHSEVVNVMEIHHKKESYKHS